MAPIHSFGLAIHTLCYALGGHHAPSAVVRAHDVQPVSSPPLHHPAPHTIKGVRKLIKGGRPGQAGWRAVDWSPTPVWHAPVRTVAAARACGRAFVHRAARMHKHLQRCAKIHSGHKGECLPRNASTPPAREPLFSGGDMPVRLCRMTAAAASASRPRCPSDWPGACCLLAAGGPAAGTGHRSSRRRPRSPCGTGTAVTPKHPCGRPGAHATCQHRPGRLQAQAPPGMNGT
jgi:hypothetical protein